MLVFVSSFRRFHCAVFLRETALLFSPQTTKRLLATFQLALSLLSDTFIFTRIMLSICNLIRCLCIVTRKTRAAPLTIRVTFSSPILVLVVCCQLHARSIDTDPSDMTELDAFREWLADARDSIEHEQFRRASLRYHPHILYKKASLKPMIGYNGKMVFNERERF